MTLLQLIKTLSNELLSPYPTDKKILIQRIIEHLSIIRRYATQYQLHQEYDYLIKEFDFIQHDLQENIKTILIDCLNFAIDKPSIKTDLPIFNVIVAMLYMCNNQLKAPPAYFAPYRQTPYIGFFLNTPQLILSPQSLYWTNPSDKTFASKLCIEWILNGTTLSLSFLENAENSTSLTLHKMPLARLYLSKILSTSESSTLLNTIKKYANNTKCLIVLSNSISDYAIAIRFLENGQIECYDPNIGLIYFSKDAWPEFFSALKAFYRAKQVDIVSITDPQKSPSYLRHYASTLYYGEKNSSLRIVNSLKKKYSYLSKSYLGVAFLLFLFNIIDNEPKSRTILLLGTILIGYGLFLLGEHSLETIQSGGLNALMTSICHPFFDNDDIDDMVDNYDAPKPNHAAMISLFNIQGPTSLNKEKLHNLIGQL